MSAAANAETEASGAVIDRFFGALAQGDVAAARACCTPDAVIWHNFDRVQMDMDAAAQAWRELITATAERPVVDVLRHPIPGGFVQRHLMVVRGHDGARRGWPIVIFVTLRDGKIARLDEYLDRASAFPIGEGDPLTTPGIARP